MQNNNISAVAVVFNEEARIKYLLDSLLWCDDVLIVDKSSTDKTQEIVNRYKNTQYIKVPYSDGGGEVKFALEASKHPWFLVLTASDIIHPKLGEELNELTHRQDFEFDIIWVPFSNQIFGIDHPASPWFRPHKPLLTRKSCLTTSNELHKEVQVTATNRHYYHHPVDNEVRVYHLTHQSIESFMERHIRYARYEANYLDKVTKKTLRKELFQIFRSGLNLLLKVRTWRMGYDGFAISIAYLSYYCLKYLFLWERYRGKGEERYIKLREKISSTKKG